MTYVLQVSTTDEVNTTNFSIKTDNTTTRHNVDNHENWKRVLETALPITNLFSAKDWYNSMKTVEAIKDANKCGALHFAAFEGQTEICKYLLEDLKLEIDSRDDDGETALIHAARQGHTATAKYLIDHGADPTIASNLGATALHHSAGMGDIELLEHLPSKGINPDLESDAGTPLPIRVELDLLEWLKPYTDVTIVELGKRGVKSLLAVPISFVSEHIETLEEIDVEYKELALESGIEKWGRVPALGCELSFIFDLADAVIESLSYVGAMAVSNVNARQSLVPLGSVEELLAAYNSTDIIIRDASPVTVIISEAIESHLPKTAKDIPKATKAPTKVKKMGEDLKRKALTEATNFQQSNAFEITRKISNEPSRNFVSKTDIHPSP
ncbi:uncharacterized protein LOC127136418 [Lathyrus oleraceus]|uniref:uncharacterized protein LOC127136418 n=1 Tax=Pisum sativum TaxID=3888 RepID=UPI0021D00782|nr:uncharacterized protein LOC127136418 [Pisum sativum]